MIHRQAVPQAFDRLFRLLQQRFRRARMKAFFSRFSIDEHTRILDVGGTPEIWSELAVNPRIILINMPGTTPNGLPERFSYVQGDGCALPFRDQSFDIVFSNSVVEHVGSPANQARFAFEIARVGKSFWVQTPNRYFPVETHLFTPLVHLLPRPISDWVFRRFSVWALIYRPPLHERLWYHNHFVDQIRLLSTRQMRTLFPDATIRSERFLFWKKSLIASHSASESSHLAGTSAKVSTIEPPKSKLPVGL